MSRSIVRNVTQIVGAKRTVSACSHAVFMIAITSSAAASTFLTVNSVRSLSSATPAAKIHYTLKVSKLTRECIRAAWTGFATEELEVKRGSKAEEVVPDRRHTGSGRDKERTGTRTRKAVALPGGGGFNGGD